MLYYRINQNELTRRQFNQATLGAFVSILMPNSPDTTPGQNESLHNPDLLNLIEGKRYPIQPPNGHIIQTGPATDIRKPEGMRSFENDSPHNKMSIVYTLDGKILLMGIHSGGADRQLPGDSVIKAETSFYNNARYRIGTDFLKTGDINILYVRDVINNQTDYHEKVWGKIRSMEGSNVLMTCYPPYRYTNAGLYAGDNLLLISGYK